MKREDALWDWEPGSPVATLINTALSLADSHYGYSQTEDVISKVSGLESFILESIVIGLENGA